MTVKAVPSTSSAKLDDTLTVQKNNNDKTPAPTEKKKKDKVPFATIETELCEIIDGLPSARLGGFKPFPYKFTTVRRSKRDQPIILHIEEDKNQAKIIETSYVAERVKEYVRHLVGKARVYNISLRQCEQVAETWARLHDTKLTQLPKAVGFKSETDLCLLRHDFDPVYITDHEQLKLHAPTFAEIKDRMTNWDAFVRRLGSILDPHCSRKQAVWVYGPQDCGKSQIPVLINMMVGEEQTIPLENDELREDYTKAALVDKRVAYINEAPLSFIKSNKFKVWTGEKEMSARNPYGRRFKFCPTTLFWCFTNDSPKIPNDGPLIRRLIVCMMTGIPKDRQILEEVLAERMRNELPWIMGHCLAMYRESDHNRVIIDSDEDVLKAAIAEGEADYLDFCAKYIEADTTSVINRIDLTNKIRAAGFTKNDQVGKCKEVVFREFGVKEVRTETPKPALNEFNEPIDGQVKSARPFIIRGIKILHV